MRDIKRRLIHVVLGVVLSFAVAGCGDDNNPSNTTSPGGSTTTVPVGS